MTGRTGSLSPEGPTISEADVARIAAEERLHHEWERRAARVVAAGSQDVADCRLLLEILGLDSATLAAARHDAPAVHADGPGVHSESAGVDDAQPVKATRKRRATAA